MLCTLSYPNRSKVRDALIYASNQQKMNDLRRFHPPQALVACPLTYWLWLKAHIGWQQPCLLATVFILTNFWLVNIYLTSIDVAFSDWHALWSDLLTHWPWEHTSCSHWPYNLNKKRLGNHKVDWIEGFWVLLWIWLLAAIWSQFYRFNTIIYTSLLHKSYNW